MTQFFSSIRSTIASIGLFGFLLIYFDIVPEDTLFISTLSKERVLFYILALSLAGTGSTFVLGRYSASLLCFNLSASVFLLEYSHWFQPFPALSSIDSLFYVTDLLILPVAYLLASLLSKLVLWAIVLPIKKVAQSEKDDRSITKPLFSPLFPVRIGLFAFLFCTPHYYFSAGLAPYFSATFEVYFLFIAIAFCISFLAMRLFSGESFHYCCGGLFGGLLLLLIVYHWWADLPIIHSALALHYPLLYASSIFLSAVLARILVDWVSLKNKQKAKAVATQR